MYFITCAFGGVTQEHSKVTKINSFILGFFIVLALTCRSKVYVELTVVYGVRYRPKFYSYACWCSTVLATLIERTNPYLLNCLGIHIKKLSTINVRFISGFSNLLLISPYVSLIQWGDNYHFVVNFEISKCEYSDCSSFSILF